MRQLLAKAVARLGFAFLWGEPPPRGEWSFRGHVGCSLIAFALQIAGGRMTVQLR